MSDVRTILERGVSGATPPPDGFERMLRRRDRKRRNERIAAGVVAVTITITIAIVVATIAIDHRDTTVPATPLQTNGDITFVGLSKFSDMATIYTVDPAGGSTDEAPRSRSRLQ